MRCYSPTILIFLTALSAYGGVYEEGRDAFRKRDYSSAGEILRAIGPNHPSFARANYVLGAIELQFKKYQKALDHFQLVQKITVDPNLENLSNLALARVQSLMGAPFDSLKSYGNLSNTSFKEQAAFELAMVLVGLNKPQEALVALAPVAKNHFGAAILKGEILLSQGHEEKARQQFDGVLARQESLWREVQIALRSKKIDYTLPEWILVAPEMKMSGQLWKQYESQKNLLKTMLADYKILASGNFGEIKTRLETRLLKQQVKLFHKQLEVSERMEELIKSREETYLSSFGAGGRLNLRLIGAKNYDIALLEVSIDGILLDGARSHLLASGFDIGLPVDDMEAHQLEVHMVSMSNAPAAKGIPKSAIGSIQFVGNPNRVTHLDVIINPKGGSPFSKESGGLQIQTRHKVVSNPLSNKEWESLKRLQQLAQQQKMELQVIRQKMVSGSNLDRTKQLLSELNALQAQHHDIKKMAEASFRTEWHALGNLIQEKKRVIEVLKWADEQKDVASNATKMAGQYIETLLKSAAVVPWVQIEKKISFLKKQSDRLNIEGLRLAQKKNEGTSRIIKRAKKESRELERNIRVFEEKRHSTEMLLEKVIRRDLEHLNKRISRNVLYADSGLLQIMLRKNQALSQKKQKIQGSKTTRLDLETLGEI